MKRLLVLLKADDDDQECFPVLSLSQFDIVEHGIHAHIAGTTVYERDQKTPSQSSFVHSGKHCNTLRAIVPLSV